MSTQELPGCKCQVVFWESGGFRMVSQCPLHRHAEDLLAACEAASDLIDRSPLGPDWRTNGQTDAYYIDRANMDALRATVRAAIARAKEGA